MKSGLVSSYSSAQLAIVSDLDAEQSQCQGTRGLRTGLYYLDAEQLDRYEYVCRYHIGEREHILSVSENEGNDN